MFGIASAALGGEITTTFVSNGAISPGGAAFFDLTVFANDIRVTSFVQNSDAALGQPFNFEVYTTIGTYVGNEQNLAVWTLQATGVGTGNGPAASMDEVGLSNPFVLDAGTSYGVAIVLPGVRQLRTNGNGTNQQYGNADLGLALGSTSNSAFTGTVFLPRVWNGTIRYVVPGNLGDLARKVMTAFQGKDTATGEDTATGKDTATGEETATGSRGADGGIVAPPLAAEPPRANPPRPAAATPQATRARRWS